MQGKWVFLVENPSVARMESFDSEPLAIARAETCAAHDRGSVAVFKAWEYPSGVVNHFAEGAARIWCSEWRSVN